MGISQITRLLTGISPGNLGKENQVNETETDVIENKSIEGEEDSHLNDRFSISSYYKKVIDIAHQFDVRHIPGNEINSLQNKLLDQELLNASNPNQARMLRLAVHTQPDSNQYDLVEVMQLYRDQLEIDRAGFHPIKEAESVSRLMTNLAALRSD